jgi:DNA repair exonuclease SbcCD nuclease subunit
VIISHLADLHIRLSHRHEEYREVFQRLYSSLRESKVDLTVIAGDLLHSKTTLSPEAVELLAEFLKNLSNIAPVVIIPGNHDLNLTNSDRLDSLSPIIKLLNSSSLENSITYYNKTGLYDYSEKVVFGVWSCIDGLNPTILKKEEKDPEKVYIALYHGVVSGARLDNNHEVKDAAIGISTFNNYDITMLGDIHSYQSIYNNNRIIFPGSLIQQSFGEQIDHGYVLWNTDTLNHQRKLLHNDYCYVTLYVTDKNVLPDLNLPSKSRIRCIFEINKEDISRTEVNTLSALIHSKYHPLSITINFKPRNKQSTESFFIDSIVNVKDYNVQKQLLSKWLIKNDIKTEYWEDVHKLDSSVFEATSNLDLEDMSNTTWDINSIEIENFMSYGEIEKIDFQKYKGIVGLFGENAAGKSVIFQAILYALFNKTSCNVKNEDYINKRNNAKFCKVRLSVSIKGMNYIIERSTRKFERPRTGEIYYRTDVILNRKYADSSECENLSETQRKETEKVIRNAIGEYEDFLLTVLSTQDKDHEFISQRGAQQTDNMLRFLGLDTFLKKHEYVIKLLREVDNLRKINSTDEQSTALSEESSKVCENKKKLIEVMLEKSSTDKLVERIRETISTLQSTSSGQKVIQETEEELELKKYNLEREISNVCKIQQDKIKEIDLIISKSAEVKFSILTEAAQFLLEAELQLVSNLKAKLKSLDNEEITTRRVISIHEKELAKSLICPVAYDENYKKCALLASTKFKLKDLENVKLELDEIKNKKKTIEDELNTSATKETEEKLRNNSLLKTEIFKLQHEQELAESFLSSLQQKLEVLTVSLSITVSKLEDYALNKENIENNKLILEKIRNLELELKDTILKQKKVLDKIIDLKQKIAVSESKISDIKIKLSELLSNDKKYAVYRTYCNAMSREGIPFSVLKQYIPIVNFEINKILSDIVDFGVYFKIEEGLIDIVMRGETDDTRPVTMASGMERLIINFSIRQVLLMLSYLNKPSTWFIDEGFGVLDSNNLYAIQKFFDFAKTIFKNIVIVTHLDGMKDIADSTILVSKIEGISHLKIK